MEPLARQSNLAPILRSATGLSSDLAAVLREGRVLVAQILEAKPGGALVLGIGGYRVPAMADVRFEMGETVLLEVVQRDGALVLRLVQGAADDGEVESLLVRALRATVGQERPVGTLLEELAAELRRALPAAGAARPEIEALLERLEARVFRPLSGSAPAAPAPLLPPQETLGRVVTAAEGVPATSAAQVAAPQAVLLGVASALAGAALTLLHSRPQAAAAELAAELRSTLVLAAEALPAGVERAQVHAALLGATTGVFERLVRAIQARGRPSRAEVASLLLEYLPDASGAMEAGPALMRVLRGMGLNYEAMLLAAVRDSGPRDSVEVLAHNLKAQLLEALHTLPQGRLREAVGRALSGLEAEQLLNLARSESGEPLHVGIAIPDGPRWTTAHLYVHRRREGGEDPEPYSTRYVLGMELSRLGAVRADLALSRESLAVRILVERSELVERIARDAESLAERLAVGERRVVVRAAVGRSEDLAVHEVGRTIDFLRENPLLDLHG